MIARRIVVLKPEVYSDNTDLQRLRIVSRNIYEYVELQDPDMDRVCLERHALGNMVMALQNKIKEMLPSPEESPLGGL